MPPGTLVQYHQYSLAMISVILNELQLTAPTNVKLDLCSTLTNLILKLFILNQMWDKAFKKKKWKQN